MLEFAASGILGSLLGGLFRLAPEILKFFDKNNERKHELNMFKLQTDLEKLRGEFKVEEKYVDFSIAQQAALAEAFKQQALDAGNSYKWVAALSALVRPAITYVLFGMYCLVKTILVSYALNSGTPVLTVAQLYWTQDDFAMLSMILTFWFLGRPLEKYRKE